ncbi:MAG: tonB-system energizer ExbB [Paracoccaceae bacterium]
MARSLSFTGASRATALAAILLTALPQLALPVIAQEQPAAPPVIEAPAQPGTALPAAEAVPTLPAAEETPPALNAPAEAQESEPAAPAAAAATPVTPPAVADTAAPTAAAEPGIQGGQGTVAPRAGAPLPHELSPWGMFMAADYVVKTVMIGLAFATFVTLTVLLYKLVEVALAKLALRRATRVIRNAESLPAAATALKGRRDPAAFMTQAALEELTKSAPALDVAGVDGVKERTRSILERTEAQAGRHLMRGTGLLATIGSTAPFVGLFGTVWGIMNSFIGISKSQTTNLAVVAPGIAEALLATAIGLVAAIPAVVVYNHFARQISGYKLALGDAGAGVERLLSRDLDFRRV